MEIKHEAHKECEEHAFHVCDKIVKSAYFNRDDGKHIRQQPVIQFKKKRR